MSNENALAIIEKAQQGGALVFVNKENFQSSVDLYKTEVTVIQSKPEEFHNLSGKFMPNRAVTDRIGEAIGVQFIGGDVRAETRDDAMAGKRTVFVGTAQGKVRMPDGSWRTSTVEEYEFDPTLRAMLDKRIDYITESNRGQFARTALEYTKVARQRASTGARLRVIRQLTGMPVSFSPEEIKKPMAFSRVVQNTAHILDTPEGRVMATAQALGADVSSLLYGKNSQSASAIGSEPAPAQDIPDTDLRPADTSGFESSASSETAPADAAALAEQANPAGSKSDEDKEFEEITVNLEALLESNRAVLDRDTRTGNPYKLAKTELEDFGSTLDSRKEMYKRISKYIDTTKGGAA